MHADDDGFCEHFSVMRMTGAKPDDLKVLQAHHFINVLDDKVLIILDWTTNNYLRPDRYTPSKYMDMYKNELKSMMKSGIPSVDLRVTQYRLVQGSKNKIKIDKTKYAEFVYFTTEEYNKLITQFTEQGTKDRIENLNLYKGSTGKKYASDYLTILNWERKNKPQPQQQGKVRKETKDFEM
jgi:hypothetical protein